MPNHYAYAHRGTSCYPITSALTSNRKFLAPDNPIYNKINVPMMQYPASSSSLMNKNSAERIKVVNKSPCCGSNSK